MLTLRTTFVALFTIFLLSMAVAAQQPSNQATTPVAEKPAAAAGDNCTWFPDGNYADCCRAHDQEYFNGGSWSDRWRSDKKLYKCVASKPKFYNKIVAPMMWLGVRAFGGAWLNTSASWGFGKRKVRKRK